jgi:hypothetical protein
MSQGRMLSTLRGYVSQGIAEGGEKLTRGDVGGMNAVLFPHNGGQSHTH